MAQPTNTFDSFEQIGNREDLSDAIYDVSPTEAPIVSSIGSTKADNRYHEWQTDALAAAVATNAVIFGNDVTASARIPTVRLGNRVQLMEKAVSISDETNWMNSAGRANEYEYQLMKSLKEIKRDLEMSLGDNNAAVTGVTDTTAPEMAGIPVWMTSNQDFGAGGAAGNGLGTTARTDGTQRAFTEAMLETVLTECWDSGGEPNKVFLGSFQQNVASGFVGRANAIDEAKAGTVQNYVDVYKTAYGQVQLVPSRFVRTRDVLILDTSMWAVAWMKKWHEVALAKTGHSTRAMIRGAMTLECRNEKSSGIVADLSTS